MVALESLRKSDLFEGLCDEELAAIARVAREETYPAGAYIFRENDAAKDIYIVREGRVAILITIGRGRQTVVDTLCEYSSFGWSAMVPPFICTGSARAIEKTRLIAISSEGLRDLCKHSCNTCYTIMEKLAMIVSCRLNDSRLQLISLVCN